VGRCLNCGAELSGAFCSACGQRAVPANPSVSEIAGDAWEELSGYDGRIAATFRALLHPGRLTTNYIEGRRARFLPPVRLYLLVSFFYFVISAAAPEQAAQSPGQVLGPGGMRIGITNSAQMTDADRAETMKALESAPWIVRPLLRALAEDSAGFRARLFAIMPRVFFAMLPVFAAIVAMFYRGRRFPVSLVFAVHLHAVAFLVFALAEAAKFAQVPALSIGLDFIVIATFLVYALASARAVFGGGWPITVVKAAGIGFVYLLASLPAFFIILLWASLT
jgi:hypothetical protein